MDGAVSFCSGRSGDARNIVGPKTTATTVASLPNTEQVSESARADSWDMLRDSALVRRRVPRRTRLFVRVETGATGLEPATSGVTGRRSNQLNYAPRAQAL
jgi:hypothetical protein